MDDNKMRNRLIAGLIMVPLFVIPIILGGWFLVLGLVYMVIVGLFEYFSVIQEKDKTYLFLASLYSTSLIIAAYVIPEQQLTVIVIGVIVLITAGMFKKQPDIKRWSLVFTGASYLGLFLSFAVHLRELPNGTNWLLTFLGGAAITDIFSFFTGVKLGRTKLAPHISPNKTWEGFAGGLIMTIIMVAAFCKLFLLTPVYWSILLGIVTACADLLGDLFASVIKRTFGVKDFGVWLLKDAHGGILDRIDGWLIVFPAAYLTIKFIIGA